MKDHSLLLSVIIVLIVPAVIFSAYPFQNETQTQTNPTIEESATEESTTARNETCDVFIKTEDGITSMDLEAYVAAVLMGEMPANFEMEALKAQAVAIRTYTLKRLRAQKHTDADVCTDPTCCQAFIDLSQQNMESEIIERFQCAVDETRGQVLTYDGQLIDATYFACSGGRTEDAAAVWGADVPYLQSQSSPGEEAANHFVDTIQVTVDEFCKKLNLPGNGSVEIGPVSYTEGGGVDKIVISGTEFTGTQVRCLLGLPSTAFRIQPVNESVVITTKGYGHRVGLSQYGADAMAVSGSTYQQILSHYYLGANLENWTASQIQGVFDKARIL